MSFRVEDKYLLRNFNKIEIYRFLNDNKFTKKYFDRKINSIYLENKNFDMFNDSEEGICPRKKIRFRYYENNLNLINIETKINSQEGKYKVSRSTNTKFLHESEKKGYYDSQYGICYPIIMVSYVREYFQNDYFRITIDKDIFFSGYKNSYKKIREEFLILEIKISKSLKIPNFLEQLPIDKLRYSKYCEGIKKIFHLSENNKINF